MYSSSLLILLGPLNILLLPHSSSSYPFFFLFSPIFHVIKKNVDDTARQAEWLSEVQQENAELRGLIEEMQTTLDLIMVKHRQQVC